MSSFPSKNSALAWILLCAGAFALAGGCGSDDGKKVARSGDAGAGGADDGGGPSHGGGEAAPAGAPNEPSAGRAGEGGGGSGAVGGEAGQFVGGSGGNGGEAGGPVSMCIPNGNISGLSLSTEPIYQVCRGSALIVDFAATSGANHFTCCGTSSSDPSFELLLAGHYGGDGGGDFDFEIPEAAPLGSYSLELSCADDPAQHFINLEVNEVPAPVVTSIPAQLMLGDDLTIQGKNLAEVDSTFAVRASDGNYFECVIDAESRTASAITCSFANIEPSEAGDHYTLHVYSDSCSYAANRPEFVVLVPPS